MHYVSSQTVHLLVCLEHISHLTCEIVQINQWFIMLAAFASLNTLCYFDIWWYTGSFIECINALLPLWLWLNQWEGFFFKKKTVHFPVCEPLPVQRQGNVVLLLYQLFDLESLFNLSWYRLKKRPLESNLLFLSYLQYIKPTCSPWLLFLSLTSH